MTRRAFAAPAPLRTTVTLRRRLRALDSCRTPVPRSSKVGGHFNRMVR